MNVIVIGAGASGLMAAHIAAKNGHKVIVIEHMPRVGKKILATGGGRCNLTNYDMSIDHFHGGDISIIENILNQCSKEDILKEFTLLGLYTVNKNGYIYPYNEQATSVLDVLRLAIKYDGINLLTECNVLKIEESNNQFYVKTDKGNFHSDKLIICTGSKCSPKTGSDGSGYDLAKGFGHSIVKVLPALCAIRCKGDYYKSVAGIRTKGRISILENDICIAADAGEIQLTNYGISGIPAMQVSHIVSRKIDSGENIKGVISFMPEFDSDSLFMFFKSRIERCSEKTVEELFSGLLHKNLAALIIKKSGVNLTQLSGKLSDDKIKNICKHLTSFEVEIIGTNSYDECQVCQGGVDLDEIKPSLESKIINGLYFCGEILDVHGDCGGYNLQWAWSSGAVAGRLG